jgi:Na+-transporting NADH:ubiquinone oxidoreductase subunit F
MTMGMAMLEILLGVLLFTAIVVFLSAVVIAARSRLVPAGSAAITINGRKTVTARIGDRLLGALADAGVNLPAACGGVGTCGLCRVSVLEGGTAALPVERALFTRRDLKGGARLACQQVVKRAMALEVAEEILGVRQWACRVRSNRNVGALIKELILDLPEGEAMDFRAGAFVQVTCPPHQLEFAQFDIDPEFRGEWEKFGLRRLRSTCTAPTTRAYSMANYPGEKGLVILDIRIALPPPGSPETVPPGVVSSWLFSLRPGDEITVAGPFGHFFAPESDREMILIGGGVGMAPMRSHILDQLKRLRSRRRISFWYGARSRQELFYVELFDRLQEEHENFRWHVALSEPKPSDHWEGSTGFIHQVVSHTHLKDHPAPEECEYFICGPPMMAHAVLGMLDGLGVEPEAIHFDDFGG